ncbi:MAG: hypothetical protein H5U40_18445 [Polyangiaceae bacterium]|nr:hypothetical protein [Polyangiaceae bacterium]
MRDALSASGKITTNGVRDPRAVKIMAKSVFRELKANGHSRGDIVSFTNALLELVTTDIREQAD